MSKVYINHIKTAVPPYDVHQKFIDFVPLMLKDAQKEKLFQRMVKQSQIAHRYSFLQPDPLPARMDVSGFYQLDRFPDMQARMRFFEAHAFSLAKDALDKLDLAVLKQQITHLITVTCTGFYAPGLDLQIMEHYQFKPSVERTNIGFMGCYAAINALKSAYHIVRSQPHAKVLIVNLELCSLHLHQTNNLEEILSFLIFADGCATTLVSAEPHGFCIDQFYAGLLSESQRQIMWHIGNTHFEMVLSGQVPLTIAKQLEQHTGFLLGNMDPQEITHWAVHPGGRSVLDKIETSLALPPEALLHSRAILNQYGNMSSATVLFVLERMLVEGAPGRGCAMAFGPGITVESMLFHTAEKA